MFNNILPELLTAIFEHLPYQSLKQALLVSRLVVIIIPNQANQSSVIGKLDERTTWVIRTDTSSV